MNCELCGKTATMYCDSDEAKLCWQCDEHVHTANFLAEKHTRVLLCHSCHLPTAWQASGRRLGPSLSFCSSCAASEHLNGAAEDPNELDESERLESEAEEEDYSDDYDDYDDGSSEEGGNQVVPWAPADMESAFQTGPQSSSHTEDFQFSEGDETDFDSYDGSHSRITRRFADESACRAIR